MKQSLPRTTPEAAGVSSAAISAFVAEIEKRGIEFHSLMVARRGAVVAEGWWRPYSAERPHILYSLSKSFLSTAAGFAVAEKRFSLDDKVISFFLEEATAEISENLAAMRIRDCLAMASGHEKEPDMWGGGDGNWPKAWLAAEVKFAPGTHFLYNSGATYMVSAILAKTTGEFLTDYLMPRLFEPLGIARPVWETDPRGIAVGGWGMSATTEDIAKFGLLYLNDGVWEGKRILPEGWVSEATRKHISNGDDPNSEWAQGYGFQFWRCKHGAYRGDGAFGQYCIVMPEQEAVIAITSNVGDMQTPLNLIWEILLPAMQKDALPENPAAQEELTAKLSALVLPLPTGSASSPTAESIAGKTFAFAENEMGVAEMKLTFDGDGGILHIHDGGGSHEIPFGASDWRLGETDFHTYTFHNPAPAVTAAAGAWPSDDTLTIRLCLLKTPSTPTITCRFFSKDNGDEMTFDLRGNIGFSPAERPLLVGKTNGR